ncbi:alpha/beta fold hydrolase [uncultured Acetatifactor sp.]|jgi:alpha-beta hydrolase superfamily lysophospholipase|uniref:alpha/beta fold hydrolase n=1 Tax=uncultured Acetatifactor sp. TaxID=1671927 RepID=UPI002626D822|nr:alpha/beta hydrolase [uncultured Acetatifactor sp.]MCI8695967.1 alpha/beta hydrolase [Lachnospiraceae bacterium]
MVKEEFYFDSRDGKSRIHAVRYRPEDTGQVRCVLQVVHGMAEYAERYEEFAAYLVERGFVVTGDDHLGHGKSVGQGGKQGYFCEQDPATVLVRDVHRLKKLTEELYPGVPYVLMGHSMGSFITRNYLCRYGTGISGAVIMGTGMQPKAVLDMARLVAGIQKLFCGSGHVSRLLDRLAFGGYGRGITDRRTAFDWLSRDRERVDRYIADPMCGFTFTVNGFGALFELVLRLYSPENLAAVPRELPVFMVSGDADPVGDYGKGVRRAYDSLVAAGLTDIRLKLYPGGRHELLNETNRSQVMQDICRWVEENVLG